MSIIFSWRTGSKAGYADWLMVRNPPVLVFGHPALLDPSIRFQASSRTEHSLSAVTFLPPSATMPDSKVYMWKAICLRQKLDLSRPRGRVSMVHKIFEALFNL
jgi:hypothetical protein